MAAAAFKAILKLVGQDGYSFTYPCTVSDVNAEYYVFPDGNNDVILPSNHGNIAVVDVVLSGTGTDTSKASVFVNGKDTGVVILNAANQGTNFSRQFMGAPLICSGASRLRIKQVT
jgi:hypothetical protein